MKKIVSLLLGLLMLVASCVALADTVVTVKPGEELTMDVSIVSASGTSAKIGISTNSAPVTFVSATGGSVNDTVPPKGFSGYFEVVNVDDITIKPDGSGLSGDVVALRDLEDGVIGKLTFRVGNDFEPGKPYTVEAYKKSGSVTVVGSVTFTVEAVEGARLAGDANDDGEVTTRDAALIMQWIAGFDVTINEANANCNGDDEVTTRDAALIMQWIAGFDVELI